MKVGTDGVLLGAWTNVDNIRRVLDIGTGTGLIAIMLAQRSNALIDAIEIEGSAAEQAMDNIRSCPWKDRIKLIPSSLQEFLTLHKTHYDLIVSNPPYFSSPYTNSNQARKMARDIKSLNLNELLEGVSQLLSVRGRFSIIYPSEFRETLVKECQKHELHANRITEIFPTPQKSSNRILMEFSTHTKMIEKNNLIIETDGRHKYSNKYISLTKDFYLNF